MVLPTSREVGSYLEQHLKRHGTKQRIYYSALISAFPGAPPLKGDWPNHPFCQVFDDLDRDDSAMGRPFRTAIVVAKKLPYLPGRGFFKTYCKLKGLPEPDSVEQMQQLHEIELARLDEFYRKPPKGA